MLQALVGCALDPFFSFSYSKYVAAKSDKYDKMVTFSIYWYLCPQAGRIISFWEIGPLGIQNKVKED